ncbi:MAG: bifunctional UDP-N-acetylglucosamine diphosphorylase/glucosamine-1-phosphate N-acetyltransferase GlmU, partial [Acholeplasmataceae bacterium]|nr:bifunctional UDP-N-acetylglucosamine diphosphorylase/glucosamine-1-phosphate N-acetyltransferase GlmU [Acholeplasmataceae bacterium]
RDQWQAMGVNDLYQVSTAEKHLREIINRRHMENGVYMINPETITLGHDVIIEPSATILPNTTITGKSIIKAGATIGPNTEIHNSVISDNTTIKHSLVFNSFVDQDSVVGPFSHLRDRASIGPNNRIGNFVEIKNSTTGTQTKASHLSYIGDATVGSRVNFGSGSITVNYDGVQKHETIIGDDVFVGCNVNIVAPLKIADQVFIAAGSTVTKDIPKGSLSIARSRQINKEDYYSHYINRNLGSLKHLKKPNK